MTQALSSIGGWLGSDAGKGVLGLGAAGAGIAQNLIAYQKQKQIQDTLTNPAKLDAMVRAETQPLSQGLTTDIARSTDAYGAERGLGSSPAVMQDIYAQALAPVEYQQQQAALKAVLDQLGMAQKGAMQPVNVASIFKALSMGGTSPGSNVTSGIDLSSIADPNSTTNWFTPGLFSSPPVDIGSTDLFSGGGGDVSFG